MVAIDGALVVEGEGEIEGSCGWTGKDGTGGRDEVMLIDKTDY